MGMCCCRNKKKTVHTDTEEPGPFCEASNDPKPETI